MARNKKKVCKRCQQMRMVVLYVSVVAILLLVMASSH